jgi:hypothetical protein
LSVLRQPSRPFAPGSQLPLLTCYVHPFLSIGAKSVSLSSHLNCCQTSLATTITRICGALLSPSRIPFRHPGTHDRRSKKLEATPGIEPGIRALQAPALPLGHAASSEHQMTEDQGNRSRSTCQHWYLRREPGSVSAAFSLRGGFQ